MIHTGKDTKIRKLRKEWDIYKHAIAIGYDDGARLVATWESLLSEMMKYPRELKNEIGEVIHALDSYAPRYLEILGIRDLPLPRKKRF